MRFSLLLTLTLAASAGALAATVLVRTAGTADAAASRPLIDAAPVTTHLADRAEALRRLETTPLPAVSRQPRPAPPEARQDDPAAEDPLADPKEWDTTAGNELHGLALRIELRRDGQQPVSLMHVRTPESVVVRALRTRAEWFFARNPVAPERVTAVRIDHWHRLLLYYSETELRLEGLPDCWERVAGFGIEPVELAALVRTDEVERAFDRVFHRYVARAEGSPLQEIWWNDAERIPLRVVREERGERIVHETVFLRGAAPGEGVTDPRLKFSVYRTLDIVDWREEACRCGSSHASAIDSLRGK
jgi:hypothetical protein